MNNQHHRRNSSGDDKFSFPTIPAAEAHHGGFEFGSTTTPPTRPSSPADRLFSNGKLLPHSFPSQPAGAAIHTTAVVHLSRSTSVTSNRDSLLSYRSNSASSSSNRSGGSGCSSARTSISESSWASTTAADRKLFSQHAAKIAAAAAARGDEYNIWSQYQAKSKPVLKPHYSSSRRWQFIAPAPGPGLRHQNSASRSRKVQCFEVREEDDEKEKKKPVRGSVSSLFRWRFFRWIVSSCRGCHAMNPPPVKDLTANT